MKDSFRLFLRLTSICFGGVLIIVNYVLLNILVTVWSNYNPALGSTKGSARYPSGTRRFPLYLTLEASIGVVGLIFGWLFVTAASLKNSLLLKTVAVTSSFLTAGCVIANMAYPVPVMYEMHCFIAVTTMLCFISAWSYSKHLESCGSNYNLV